MKIFVTGHSSRVGGGISVAKNLISALVRPPLEFLCGGGSGSSIATLGTGAHNEWLEFVFNYGATGGLLYAVMIFSLVWHLAIGYDGKPLR